MSTPGNSACAQARRSCVTSKSWGAMRDARLRRCIPDGGGSPLSPPAAARRSPLTSTGRGWLGPRALARLSPKPLGFGDSSLLSSPLGVSWRFVALHGVSSSLVALHGVSLRFMALRDLYAFTRSELQSPSRSRFGCRLSHAQIRPASSTRPRWRIASTILEDVPSCAPRSRSMDSKSSVPTVPRSSFALALSSRNAHTAITSPNLADALFETSWNFGSKTLPWCQRNQSMPPAIRSLLRFSLPIRRCARQILRW